MSDGEIPVVVPPGELHDDSLPAFALVVDPLVDGAKGPGLIVDLSGLKFMSSTGLGYLVKIGMSLDREQRRLALACGSRRVTKLIKVTGLGSLLPHFGTLEDARHFVAGGATATS